ncbi:MAG: retropepsin-like aspartic protease [Bacteroidales bacterium]|nr:retropepsin-like aspartic protease [Bacteroidales bacterium]MDT8429943.1 retropepsin-like aspartic protease [Bacteroidales bacterium]
MVAIILLNCVVSCNRTATDMQHDLAVSLAELYSNEAYFELWEQYQASGHLLPKAYRIYFKALSENAFYAHEASNKSIDKLLDKFLDALSGEELKNMYKTRYMNYSNLHEYSEALESCSLLIADYQHLIDTPAYEHLLNERKILEALVDTPPQEVIKPADCGVRLRKDKMGLVNIPVSIGDTTIDMLFDTGSSFSFIKRSIAAQLGAELIDVDFEVEGITGNVVVCDLAVTDELFLGSIGVQHTVFWVFDDADLTLPEYDYSVNGAIAFPVLKALGEFHIIRNDSVFIPVQTRDYNIFNLAIDDLDPVVAVVVEQDTLPWYFDTGAAFSSFYKPYYDMYSGVIDSTCEMHTYDIGGLGGTREFTSYIIDSIYLEIGGSGVYIHDTEVHTASIYKDPEKVYGNLGQDFIFQFDKMVISTHSASMFFE